MNTNVYKYIYYIIILLLILLIIYYANQSYIYKEGLKNQTNNANFLSTLEIPQFTLTVPKSSTSSTSSELNDFKIYCITKNSPPSSSSPPVNKCVIAQNKDISNLTLPYSQNHNYKPISVENGTAGIADCLLNCVYKQKGLEKYQPCCMLGKCMCLPTAFCTSPKNSTSAPSPNCSKEDAWKPIKNTACSPNPCPPLPPAPIKPTTCCVEGVCVDAFPNTFCDISYTDISTCKANCKPPKLPGIWKPCCINGTCMNMPEKFCPNTENVYTDMSVCKANCYVPPIFPHGKLPFSSLLASLDPSKYSNSPPPSRPPPKHPYPSLTSGKSHTYIVGGKDIKQSCKCPDGSTGIKKNIGTVSKILNNIYSKYIDPEVKSKPIIQSCICSNKKKTVYNKHYYNKQYLNSFHPALNN